MRPPNVWSAEVIFLIDMSIRRICHRSIVTQIILFGRPWPAPFIKCMNPVPKQTNIHLDIFTSKNPSSIPVCNHVQNQLPSLDHTTLDLSYKGRGVNDGINFISVWSKDGARSCPTRRYVGTPRRGWGWGASRTSRKGDELPKGRRYKISGGLTR